MLKIKIYTCGTNGEVEAFFLKNNRFSYFCIQIQYHCCPVKVLDDYYKV